MLTKEDYMKLPKERLAELLVERDMPVIHIPYSQMARPCPDCPLQYDYGKITYTTTQASTDKIENKPCKNEKEDGEDY